MVSKEFANKINAEIFGAQNYIPPTIWYFGLSTQPITDGTIPVGAEPTNPGYSRTEIANNQTNFTEPTYNATYTLSYVSNKNAIAMSEITGGSQITVPYFFLSSSNAGNKCEIWGNFANARILTADSQLIIKAGGAIFSLENI
uniref:Uncharacterized protein n=1 Tax=Siphoviridae sp. ctyvQ1 TaxID=2826525 RepID=A0A8S5QZC3_9CAUD|nr:MAG TPA: hypothetical protein [Siphoviridae sp. ctyvQ1]